MRRLIEKGLMFGNLVLVDTPALVERYNRALVKLTGKTTALTDFYIDISGFSPEVADELGDQLYLNPNGCNRQFIILSTAQRTAPLLDAKFSTSRRILQKFIDENEAALFALTTRDAVAGELQNSVYDVSVPERLFDIRRITVEADTTDSRVAEARKLSEKIERFTTEEDAWFDDVLIAEMIDLAKQTGDVSRNPIALETLSVEQGNFWTSHFGGLYVFRDVHHPAAISVEPIENFAKLPIGYQCDLRARNAIAKFFELNGLAEPIVRARGVDGAAVLGQKMDYILLDAAAQAGRDIHYGTKREFRTIARELGSRLPEEFHGLGALKRWAEAGGPWPKINSEHPAYFYTLRARPGPDAELVNQLLAELTPLDVRQMFICHKQLFYAAYRGWQDAKREWVANMLEAEYMIDKAGARDALFGGVPMEVPSLPEISRPQQKPDIIDLVGPWGAATRRRT